MEFGIKLLLVLLVGLCATVSGEGASKTVVQIEIGEHCDLASAPTEEDGSSWHVVEHGVEKVCSPGSSCRGGACNCDDLADGTMTGLSQDNEGTRVCRNLAGQKCSSDDECFKDVKCIKEVCTCPEDVHCQSTKNDVYILD